MAIKALHDKIHPWLDDPESSDWGRSSLPATVPVGNASSYAASANPLPLVAATITANDPSQVSLSAASAETAMPSVATVLVQPSASAAPAGSGGPAGRGAYLLPTGYLSTSGSQIVDSAGNFVRIASVGWDGMLLANGAPIGLDKMSLSSAVASMKSEGFNTIRLPWTDAMLLNNTKPDPRLINYSLNLDLQGLTSMQLLDKVIAAAGKAGLKVILDHHNNEATGGTLPRNAGHQTNGLWYDVGPGTDGTDGSGNAGTVSAAQFKADWVTIASRYAGNGTVIGFDLDNEPGPNGNINWGQGGPTDIHAMATAVGNAIQQVNPGALIIVEGPMEPAPGSGMPAPGPEGNLSGVAAKPVVLTIPNKVVYSVHEYPASILGTFVPPLQYIMQMDRAWGYLVAQDIAPVWVGEMGSSMTNGPSDNIWATVLLDYMNGKFSAAGGPSVTGNHQPVGGDWWTWGYEAGAVGHTLASDWSTSLPAVQAVTDRMLFISPTASVNPASVPATSTVQTARPMLADIFAQSLTDVLAATIPAVLASALSSQLSSAESSPSYSTSPPAGSSSIRIVPSLADQIFKH